MALIKRKIKDSVSVSGGRPPPGSSGSRRNRGGGGGIRASIINKAQQEKDAREKAAHDQKAFRAAQIKKQTQTAKAYNRQLKEAEVSRRKKKDEGKISTGVFSKGGAVVQETRGDFQSLERLNKQRPGSVLVQTKAGDYVLVEARGGINLSKKGTLDRFNENLKLEGRGLFYSIGEKNEQGGTDFKRRISDSVGASGGIGGFIESETKSRPAQPREIAEMITEDKIKPTFIGQPTLLVSAQQTKAIQQQKIKTQVFPQTFIDPRGQDVVTITGKSQGSKFGIFQSVKEGREIGQKEASLKGSSVLNFLEAKSKPRQPTLRQAVSIGASDTLLNLAAIGVAVHKNIMGGSIEEGSKAATEFVQKYREPEIESFSSPDIVRRGAELGTLGFITAGGIGGVSKAVGKLKGILPKKEVKPPKFANEKPGKNQFRQNLNRDVFDKDTAIYGFKGQRVKLSTGITKQIITSKGIKLDQDSILVPGKDFVKTKLSLGKGVVGIPATPKVKKLTLDGDDLIKTGGKDFVRSSVALGSGALKTPSRKITSSLDRPVKPDPTYSVSDKPVELQPFEKVRLNLGVSQVQKVKNQNLIQRPDKDFVKRTIPKKPDEVRTKSGQILIMKEPVQVKQFTSTKLSLGKSKQTFQTKSLSKIKSKSSQTFLISGIATTPVYAVSQKPQLSSSSKTSLISMVDIRRKLREKQKPITAITPKLQTKQKQRLRLAAPLRPKQPTRQKQTPIQKQPPIQKQIIEEVPPEIPITRLIVTPLPNIRQRTKRVRPKKVNLNKVNFLGSTNIETVGGFRTKEDFAFGKRSGRLARKNVSLTRSKIGIGVSIF